MLRARLAHLPSSIRTRVLQDAVTRVAGAASPFAILFWPLALRGTIALVLRAVVEGVVLPQVAAGGANVVLDVVDRQLQNRSAAVVSGTQLLLRGLLACNPFA